MNRQDDSSARLAREEVEWLRAAIDLAAASRAAGDAPFGSLLVDRDGVVLAEERNSVTSDRDITAHPELKLARWAARELTAEEAATSTLFTSCEPCGMCSGAIDRSGIGRVVFSLTSVRLNDLKRSGHFPPTAWSGPFLEDEGAAIVDGFY